MERDKPFWYDKVSECSAKGDPTYSDEEIWYTPTELACYSLIEIYDALGSEDSQWEVFYKNLDDDGVKVLAGLGATWTRWIEKVQESAPLAKELRGRILERGLCEDELLSPDDPFRGYIDRLGAQLLELITRDTDT